MNVFIHDFIRKGSSDETVNFHLINVLEITDYFLQFWSNFNEPLIRQRLTFFLSSFIHVINLFCGYTGSDNLVPTYFICCFFNETRFNVTHPILKKHELLLKKRI